MLLRLTRIIAALMWALICIVIALFFLALAFGRSTDGIKGAWQIVPLLGQLAVLLGVGIFAFCQAMRASSKWATRREI